MTSPCKEEVLLSAYLDGELPEPQSDAVAKHLESCPRCRQTLASLTHTDAMLQSLPQLEPSSRFERTFRQKVAALERKQKRYAWIRYLFSGWRPVLAGGLAGIAAVVIYTSGNKALGPEEMFIAEHMELLENFDMIGDLEMLEHWEAVETMREQT